LPPDIYTANRQWYVIFEYGIQALTMKQLTLSVFTYEDSLII